MNVHATNLISHWRDGRQILELGPRGFFLLLQNTNAFHKAVILWRYLGVRIRFKKKGMITKEALLQVPNTNVRLPHLCLRIG